MEYSPIKKNTIVLLSCLSIDSSQFFFFGEESFSNNMREIVCKDASISSNKRSRLLDLKSKFSSSVFKDFISFFTMSINAL